jgi:hypothetical protein
MEDKLCFRLISTLRKVNLQRRVYRIFDSQYNNNNNNNNNNNKNNNNIIIIIISLKLLSR